MSIQHLQSSGLCVVAAFVGMACAGVASAEVVRVSTAGVIEQSNINAIAVSDAFSFWFDVDLSMSSDSEPGTSVGVFEGAVVGFGVSAGSLSFGGSGPGDMVISHYSSGNEFDVDGVNLDLNSTDHFSHEFIRSIRFELVHFGGDYFSSDHLDEVLGLGNINAWDEVRSFSLTGSTPDLGAGGEITSISVTTIPAPSSLAIFGCFGAAAARRRR